MTIIRYICLLDKKLALFWCGWCGAHDKFPLHAVLASYVCVFCKVIRVGFWRHDGGGKSFARSRLLPTRARGAEETWVWRRWNWKAQLLVARERELKARFCTHTPPTMLNMSTRRWWKSWKFHPSFHYNSTSANSITLFPLHSSVSFSFFDVVRCCVSFVVIMSTYRIGLNISKANVDEKDDREKEPSKNFSSTFQVFPLILLISFAREASLLLFYLCL